MGEIAEMMVDGTLCAYCVVPVGVSGGFPVLCEECWPQEVQEYGMSDVEGVSANGYQRAALFQEDEDD